MKNRKVGILIADPDEITQKELDAMLEGTNYTGIVSGIGKENAINGVYKLIVRDVFDIVNIGLTGCFDKTIPTGTVITDKDVVYTAPKFLEKSQVAGLSKKGYKCVDMELKWIIETAQAYQCKVETRKIVSDHLSYREYKKNLPSLKQAIIDEIKKVIK